MDQFHFLSSLICLSNFPQSSAFETFYKLGEKVGAWYKYNYAKRYEIQVLTVY